MPSVIENTGLIEFGDGVCIGGGCQICTVNKNSELILGNKVSVTSECHICCAKKIVIGAKSIISWNTQIMDTDFHDIRLDGKLINKDADVFIGKSCWIASRSCILKGTFLADNVIVASNSTISGEVLESNVIVMGLPVKVLKKMLVWGSDESIKK